LNDRPLRVGVFGGSFDPPHQAHRQLLAQAVAQLQLDCVHVIPVGQAWHKARALTASEHRLAMTRLAFADLDKVRVDDREIRRPGPSFTVDTLAELQQEYPQAQLVLIIGGDQARALPSWHRWPEIAQSAIISIAGRACAPGTEAGLNDPLHKLGRYIALDLPALNLSATDIRERVATRQGIAHLVPDGVARYIEQHHLYQTP
jgi:nicotinate-nucleotide adenylyltransferase